MILSNGQFDVKDTLYLFKPEKEKFIPIYGGRWIEEYIDNLDSVFLYYFSSETSNSSIKHFTLELIQHDNTVEKESGTLFKSNPNKDYENKVKHMLRKAVELSRKK